MERPPRSGGRLAALALAQIVAWGVMYYAVLVAAPAIADDTGWNDDAVFVAITLGLLTSAVCAIPVGHRLDRHPRRIMVMGAVVGTVALIGAAAAPTIWVFTAGWILCGAAQSALLYQAAFPGSIGPHDPRRQAVGRFRSALATQQERVECPPGECDEHDGARHREQLRRLREDAEAHDERGRSCGRVRRLQQREHERRDGHR